MEPLQINSKLVLPADELVLSFARSGGPGGQNVNKVETKVQLRFNLRTSAALGEARKSRLFAALANRLTLAGELLVESTRTRERARNIEDAREKLAALLRAALAPTKVRRATKPTRGSQRRRLEAKRRRSDTKRRRQGGGSGDE